MVIKILGHMPLNLITALPGIVFPHIYNVSKACIMLVLETIWNCREIDKKNVHLKHTL